MKAYFVNPSEKELLDTAGDRMPLQLLYLVAWNRQKFPNTEFKIIDLNHTSTQDFASLIYNKQPDFVAFTAYSSTIIQASRLADVTKDLSPFTKTIVGGYHPSALPQTIGDEFDYVVVGEGEKSLERILRGEQERIVTSERVFNLDEIPFPARDLLDSSKYNLIYDGKRTATLISSRGCMMNCNFCGGKVMYKSMRQRSVDNVIKEVKELKKQGYESLYFVDDSLTTNPKWIQEFSQKMKPLGMTYRATTRADLINREKLQALKDSGLSLLSFAGETGYNYMLTLLNKHETIEDVKKAGKLCKELKISFKTFWIVGLPGETEESALHTLEVAKEINSNTADFYIFQPYPGCEFWNHPEKYGIKIKNTNFNKYLQAQKKGRIVKSNIDLETLSSDEIERLHILVNMGWKEFKDGQK